MHAYILYWYSLFVHFSVTGFYAFSGEDGRSRAVQLLHILKQIDRCVCSPVEYQKKNCCHASYEMLLKFRTPCMSLYCLLGCQGSCTHSKQIDSTPNSSLSSFPSAYLLPSHNALFLGDRIMVYLPRCADTNSEVTETSAPILVLLFSIALSLPRIAISSSGADIESSYSALYLWRMSLPFCG
ncbi:hypothetical protein RJ641_025199, partial [Dillenia turbinata]